MKPTYKIFRKKPPLYLFMHIPKTGGTSLFEHASEWFGLKNILVLSTEKPIENNFDVNRFYNNEKIIELNKKSIQHHAHFDAVFGHFRYGLHEYFPDRECRYITFMRHPVKQFISAYNYFKVFKDEFHQPECITDALYHKHSHANIQTYFISGAISLNELNNNPDFYFKTAISNIKNHFFYLGCTEKFNESIDTLSFKLNKTIKEYHHKKKGTYNYESILPYEKELIKKVYHLDLKLYNYFFSENQFFTHCQQGYPNDIIF